ncbi:non-canonical purine NTP pyrophosphatase [Sorangium sp. So ce406]|uniref:non-canonical purine NTP pyrophosphatase n=1 Tax=Sorangium sp. So ce406 TaxID=3133311 RepID=UPI003F5B72E9
MRATAMVYFVSSNERKLEDMVHAWQGGPTPLRLLLLDVPEVLSSDLDTVVREKAIAAYRVALVPLFVEHGGLFIEHLNGFPGPLVKPFWERLQDRICSLIPPGLSRAARVVQKVCYCDGRTLRVYTGTVPGEIACERRGECGTDWEPMFVPAGHTETLGQMPREERLRCSASAEALRVFRSDIGL